MKSFKLISSIALAGTVAFAAIAYGGELQPNGSNQSPKASDTTAQPPGPLQTSALLAVWVAPGGTIQRSVNVQKVRHVGAGLYCVLPKLEVDKKNTYPVATPQWDGSVGSSLLAYYQDGKGDCKKLELEVRTYDFSTGTPVLSDTVGFYLFVI